MWNNKNEKQNGWRKNKGRHTKRKAQADWTPVTRFNADWTRTMVVKRRAKLVQPENVTNRNVRFWNYGSSTNWRWRRCSGKAQSHDVAAIEQASTPSSKEEQAPWSKRIEIQRSWKFKTKERRESGTTNFHRNLRKRTRQEFEKTERKRKATGFSPYMRL